MTTTETTDFALRVADILRPLGITRNMRAYRILRDALARIYEQEDRLEAVQKEVYEPLSEQYHCYWTAIQSTIRRAAQIAWNTSPEHVQQLAGYPLTGTPSVVQFFGDAVQCAGEKGLMGEGTGKKKIRRKDGDGKVRLGKHKADQTKIIRTYFR